jgi:hypothetical protein
LADAHMEKKDRVGYDVVVLKAAGFLFLVGSEF